MELYERLNQIIKGKSFTKRKFSDLLRSLEPKLKSTGEIPTEKTIYKYLSGDINIPVELLSYIAEALDITEQELFENNTQTKVKLHKYISKGLDKQQFSYINNLSSNATLIRETHSKYGKENNKNMTHTPESIKKLLSLLEYATPSMIEKINSKLEEIKKITLSDIEY